MSGWCANVLDNGTLATLYKLGEEPAVSMGTMAVWESATKGAFDTLVRRFMSLEDVRAEEEVKEILFGETGKQFAAAILTPWFKDLKDNARTDYIIAKFVGPNDPSGQLLNIFAGDFNTGVGNLVSEYHRWLKFHIDNMRGNRKSRYANQLYQLLQENNLHDDAEHVYQDFQQRVELRYATWKPSATSKGNLKHPDSAPNTYTLENKRDTVSKNNLGDSFFYFVIAFCNFRRLYTATSSATDLKKTAFDFLVKTLVPTTVKWLNLSKTNEENSQYYLTTTTGHQTDEAVEFDNVEPLSNTNFEIEHSGIITNPLGLPSDELLIESDTYHITLAPSWENLARGFFL